MSSAGSRRSGRAAKVGIALGVAVGAIAAAHGGVVLLTPIRPPTIRDTTGEIGEVAGDPDAAVVGPAWRDKIGKLSVVSLQGSPEEIGHQHARLLGREMRANEARLFDLFETFVPLAPARWLVVDLARVQFRRVD